VRVNRNERVKIDKGTPEERPIHRFPRTNNKYALFTAQLRAEFPAPEYNPRFDGAYDPAAKVLSWAIAQGLTKLKALCIHHSLDPSDSKRDMVKKLYLHWRARKMKLRLGSEHYGYGPGFMNTRIPNCACGFLKIPIVRFFRRMRFPRPYRFPR
jgi:hypothetical protein